MDGDLPLSILSLNYEQIGANFSTGFLDGHFYFGVTPEFRIRDFMLNEVKYFKYKIKLWFIIKYIFKISYMSYKWAKI